MQPRARSPATARPAAATASDSGNGSDRGNSDELGASTIDGGLSGERAAIWPAIALGVACALVWIAAWLLGKLWSKWPAYLLCPPLFLLMLFFFFENSARAAGQLLIGPVVPYDRGPGGTVPAVAGTPETRTAAP